MKKTMILISPHDVFPPRDGGERRIYLLIKELVKSYNIIYVGPVLTNKNSVDLPIEIVEVFPNKAKYKTFNITLIKTLRDMLNKYPDAEIRLEFPWQGINLLLLGKRFILDEHNVEFLRFKRAGLKKWLIVYIYEFIICHLSNRIICVSETDKNYFIKYLKLDPAKIEIIENPVDTSIFYQDSKNNGKIRQELGLKDSEKFILYFGHMDNHPSVEALGVIINNILPGLEKRKVSYKLIICGKGNGRGLLKSLNHKNVIFKGLVDRIQDYINASDVVIVPLKSGSGTRMKILESLACGKRVISTTIGAEGLKENKLLEIEDDWERFIDLTVRRML